VLRVLPTWFSDNVRNGFVGKTEDIMSEHPRSVSFRSVWAIVCILSLIPGDTLAYSDIPAQAHTQTTTQAPASTQGNDAASKIPPDQLDSLVAPIALYPDPLLAQVLAASTYPLEIIQLQQWLQRNKNLNEKALADAVAKEPWDPSVQALAALPDVVKRLSDDIQWTTDLGNAFLAQQNDVMDAVQRMRKKAEEKGNLKDSEQMKVETKVVDGKTTIIIEQANPQVIYVPSYDPTVVWGSPLYPYPPIYYPPAGYYAAGMALSFGVGVAMGAFWGGGGWGWGCGWGGNNNVYVNRNANFNRNTNINGGNRGNINGGNRGNIGGGNLGNRASTLPAGGGNRWQHNPQHRGGAPYRDRATADRFGGTTRGDSLANRQSGARSQLGRQGGNLGSNRAGGAGAGSRGGDGALGGRAGGGAGNRQAGGGDRVGNRDLSRNGGGNRDAFGGGSKGFNGASSRANSNRGASSMRSFGGGGGRRGGGGFRGGGGGRRR
jgi:hypothetical protein